MPRDATPTTRAPTRARILNGIRIALAVLVLAAVGVALQRNWHEVSIHLRRLDAGTLLLSLVLSLLAPVLTLLGWRTLLADLGTRLPLPAAASVFFVGQLGKYLPGSVWSIVAQTEMGSRLGVPRRRMGVVGLLTIGMAVIAGFVVGVPAIPLILVRTGEHVSWWWALPAVLVVAASMWPRLLNWAVSTMLGLMRREPLEHALSGGAIAQTMGWFVAAWVVTGASVWVLARAVAPDAPAGALAVASICGFSVAASVGMFSVFVPAGVGVRDGVLAFLLAGLMPVGAATAVVVITRFLTVVVDVAVAAFGWLWGRSHHLLGHDRTASEDPT